MGTKKETIINVESASYGQVEFETSIANGIVYTFTKEAFSRLEKTETAKILGQAGFYAFIGQVKENSVSSEQILYMQKNDSLGVSESIQQTVSKYETNLTNIIIITVKDAESAENIFNAYAQDASNHGFYKGKNFKKSKVGAELDGLKAKMQLLGFSDIAPLSLTKVKKLLGSYLYFKKFAIDAKIEVKDDELLLLSGSRVSINPTDSCKDYIRRNREVHKNKILAGIVLDDISFKTLGQIACFIYYGNINGRDVLINASGKSANDVM